MKQIIRLTKSDLHRIVKESIDRILDQPKNMEEFLRQHLFVEYYFNGGLIKEGRDFLFEGFGIFKGCFELAKEIYSKIVGRDSDDNILIKSNLNWLDYIVIEIDEKSDDFGYISNRTILNTNGSFYKIIISVPKVTNYNFMGSIMHELLHAYQDYNLRKKNTSLLSKNIDSKYFDNYRLGSDENDKVSYIISKLLYYLNYYEKNAYIASLTGLLYGTDKEFNTVNDVFNFVKSTNIYKNYQILNSFVEQIEWVRNSGNEDLKKKISQEVSKRSNLNFKNFGQLVSFFRNKINQITLKINKEIPKIIHKYFSLPETMIPSSDKILKGIKLK